MKTRLGVHLAYQDFFDAYSARLQAFKGLFQLLRYDNLRLVQRFSRSQ